MGDGGRTPVCWHIPGDLKTYVERLAHDRHVSGWEAISDIIRVHKFATESQQGCSPVMIDKPKDTDKQCLIKPL